MDFAFFIVFVFYTVVGVVALPSEILDRETEASFYSSTWGDGTAKYTYTNGPNGQYGVTWSGDKGNFVVGKGYNPGGPRYDSLIPTTPKSHRKVAHRSTRAVDYSGTFEPDGNAYLSLYGWSTGPLVE